MVRADWLSLNGVWELGPAEEEGTSPPSTLLPERVLVPFPLQSALSGIQHREGRVWYRRNFEIPAGWGDRRVLLHFGAVTHQATVWVNGVEVGSHRGSYDPFSLDITAQLDRSGTNELAVRVVDPEGEMGEPIGKQFFASLAVLFSGSTGIWQPVWLEPVPERFVRRVLLTPDPEAERVSALIDVDGASPEDMVVVSVIRSAEVVGTARGAPGTAFDVPVPSPRLWSPDDPFLYDIEVTLEGAGGELDRVESYVGMRSVGVVDIDGVPRLVLNGEPVFQIGVLDQGYWPDGLYSAPADEALRFDIEAAKDMGFNVIRKHVKVEPQRWYWWADRLGVLVWQDMPNMQIYREVTDAAAAQFELELERMIDALAPHPSIVPWAPFNEGWGQFDVERVVQETKERDPSRIVLGNSGSANCCLAIEVAASDIRSSHMYSGPFAPAPAGRPSVTGEFGTCEGRVDDQSGFPSAPSATMPLCPTCRTKGTSAGSGTPSSSSCARQACPRRSTRNSTTSSRSWPGSSPTTDASTSAGPPCSGSSTSRSSPRP